MTGKEHHIIFTPSGVRASVEEAATIYEAALSAGVDMQSICGGKGLCKRCQIEISPGAHAKFKINVDEESVAPLTATEKKAIADGDLPEGRRLACRAKICGDLVVDIPSDARNSETSISKKSVGFSTELNPPVKLYMCALEKPSLEDNPSDSEALSLALETFGVSAKPSLRVLSKVQKLLAENDRQVIAVVRDDREVIDVWPPSPFNVYGAAIDIGSTSVALYLYDLCQGELAYEASAMNPQIRFGEDLMSRVSYVMMNKEGDHLLTDAIRKQIAKMIQDAQAALSLGANQILELAVVGNPIMHHLFLGVSPVELGQAPFTLAIKDWFEAPANDLGLGISEAARVSFLPLIGGHVGADASGAYLAQINEMTDRSVLLVDIGTNAEIVLSHGGRVAAASSPTGPAFEGAEISAGVRASPGAIERVRIDEQTKEPMFKIIGCDEWLSDQQEDLSAHAVTGICGSGIFEVMAALASAGLVDDSGLFRPDQAPARFFEEGKSWKYLLVRRDDKPIYIKQTDIRAVQLAKAALSAGVSLLTEHLGCDHVDEILLAGAFGTHLDPKFVADIGIIPGASAENVRSIGNAAGMGAAMTLFNTNEKMRIIEAVAQIEKVETATQPAFQEFFVNAMTFPTAPKAGAAAKTGRGRRKRVRSPSPVL